MQPYGEPYGSTVRFDFLIVEVIQIEKNIIFSTLEFMLMVSDMLYTQKDWIKNLLNYYKT
jgi:hypothetical protein